jgi:hypothetical protein
MARGRVEGVGRPTQALCEVVLAAAVVDVVQCVRDRPRRHIIIFNRRRGSFLGHSSKFIGAHNSLEVVKMDANRIHRILMLILI